MASTLIKNTSLGRGKTATISTRQIIPSMMAHRGWDKLENKEKDLCSENDIEPEDYIQLK